MSGVVCAHLLSRLHYVAAESLLLQLPVFLNTFQSLHVLLKVTQIQHNHTQLQFYGDYTHTHPFNGPLSRTTWVSWYQKGKTNLDFTEARDSEWQWHQLGHMEVCTSLQTDNHANTPPLNFFTGRMPFLTPNQQRQITEEFLRPLYICIYTEPACPPSKSTAAITKTKKPQLNNKKCFS